MGTAQFILRIFFNYARYRVEKKTAKEHRARMGDSALLYTAGTAIESSAA